MLSYVVIVLRCVASYVVLSCVLLDSVVFLRYIVSYDVQCYIMCYVVFCCVVS